MTNPSVQPDRPVSTAPAGSRPPAGRGLGQRLIRRIFPLVLFAMGGLFLLSFSGRVPTNIGNIDGRLAECPASPNCVSTQTDQTDKQMPAIEFAGDPADAVKKLKSVIAETFPRAKLICEKQNYLHYEFVSLIFRFVDDVEFLVNDSSKQIGFRSASRVGHSDMGKNRKRMEKISTEMKR